MNRSTATALTTAVACLAAAAPAPAWGAELMASSLSTGGTTRASSCSERPLAPGPGITTRATTAPQSGWVRAELDGPSAGDWDLAVFDRASQRLVAASSSFGADEVAEGLAVDGTPLLVQACRMSGAGERAQLSVGSTGLPDAPAEKVALARVSTPTRERKNVLSSLGLDMTEHGGKGFVSVLLHGEDDARTLRENKFSYTIETRDLVRQDMVHRAADARYASRVRASALPSGRDAYRRLNNYSEDLKKLVDENPGLVRPITLPHKTWEGRTVEGVEITTNVDNLSDGKPVFVQMGVHHAREWPSGEHAIEWAFELVNAYKSGNGRTRRLVRNVRTIVIPLVNPDGFNISREAGQAQQGGDGRGTPNPGEGDETVNIVSHPYEYRRKNCRNPEGEGGNCAGPAAGVASTGVDPNRNYGAFWGGPGASGAITNETYHGPAAFSEPETQNIRALVSSRQVTTLITNHTFSDLVLRAPGMKSQGLAPDEPAMKALGDSMAAENGYLSMYGWQLYDTTGTTEDWSYSATGGYGYTFEIGCVALNRTTNECDTGHFHPPFAEMVKEWEGTTAIADEGGRDGRGNREAYYKAMENAANERHHSMLGGTAPSGLLLRLRKAFETPTSKDEAPKDGNPDTFTDTLDTTYEVPADGSLGWHINPSTRPLVAEDKGRLATGEPSPPQEYKNNAPPAPPCPGPLLPGCYRDHVIDVPAGAGIDNGFATVRVEWPSVVSDYDIFVYRDTNGNGAVDDGEPEEGAGTQGTTDFEQVTLGPDPSGRYILRVQNWAAAEPYDVLVSFAKPTFTAAQRENWSLSCETFGGAVLDRREVYVARGERATVSLSACAAAVREAFATGEGCDDPTGRLRGRRLDRVRLGGQRDAHLRAYKIGRKQTRSGIDRFCLSDSRGVRVGYPTERLYRAVGSQAGRRPAANSAVLALTTSRRFRIRRIRVGTPERVLLRRIGGRPIRIGANRWYTKRAKRARIVFKVKGGKVRELGLVNKRLTSTRLKARRTLSAWRLR